MKKRYAVVGTGGRSGQYIKAMACDFRDYAEIVGFCDINPGRMAYYNGKLQEVGLPAVPTYLAKDFDKMILETKPDIVIVTSIDRTHHLYGCRAMELGCDVVSEKPMTIDVEKCQQIIDTQKRTGRHYRVTFNYRYAPRNARVKELLQQGICGDITGVHFEWLLDTSHGADYFRRWHRNKCNSGGLLVHKATHHFDLVNWWIDSQPETVFAFGDLRFYGRRNAEARGVTEFYSRSRNSPLAAKDPFAIHIDEANMKRDRALYYDNEQYDGYQRDQSVFGDGIDIEDNMSVLVRYKNRAMMSYSLCAHQPWEGLRVCFNGTKGRLEYNHVERGVTPPDLELSNFGIEDPGDGVDPVRCGVPDIIFQPMWGKTQIFKYDENVHTGHGGGDQRLFQDVFVGVDNDPLGRAADFKDGANSILTGVSANISMRTGLPVKVQELLKW